MKNINELFRSGTILVKYKICPNDTKHIFCIELNEKYFTFIMKKGIAVNQNDTEIFKIKGTKNKGKYFDIYKDSSLNLITG